MGRKACVVARSASIGKKMFERRGLVIEPDIRDLEAENRALRAELEEVSSRLAREAAHRAELEAALGHPDGGGDAGRPGDVYVFDDGDQVADDFDRFFASPDPHLDKVRGFLLD